MAGRKTTFLKFHLAKDEYCGFMADSHPHCHAHLNSVRLTREELCGGQMISCSFLTKQICQSSTTLSNPNNSSFFFPHHPLD